MDQPTVIYETVHGSTAYGLARAGSDVDVKGVVIGPSGWYLGWAGGPEHIDLSPDHVRYDIRKFFRLAVDANPTVLELLWTRDEHHRVVTDAGRRLIEARDGFLSQRVAERFGRYALAQLKRIRTHRAWLHSPPAGAPTRSQFGLPDRTVIPADQLAAAQALLEESDLDAVDVSPDFVELLTREKRYKSAQTQWRHYNDWLKNRNPARSYLETRFGYDTKHGMHLVRLQRMALEVLTTGTVNVFRPDRDELLAIRDGAWAFDELEARTSDLAAKIDDAVRSSPLPARPDEAALDRLCVELVAEHLGC
jgi:predicted nucleotidyltransferase